MDIYADIIRVFAPKAEFTGEKLKKGMFGCTTDSHELVVRDPTTGYHFYGDYNIEDISGLIVALEGKAPLEHVHIIEDVTGLQVALDDAITGTGIVDHFPIFTDSKELTSSTLKYLSAQNRIITTSELHAEGVRVGGAINPPGQPFLHFTEEEDEGSQIGVATFFRGGTAYSMYPKPTGWTLNFEGTPNVFASRATVRGNLYVDDDLAVGTDLNPMNKIHAHTPGGTECYLQLSNGNNAPLATQGLLVGVNSAGNPFIKSSVTSNYGYSLTMVVPDGVGGDFSLAKFGRIDIAPSTRVPGLEIRGILKSKIFTDQSVTGLALQNRFSNTAGTSVQIDFVNSTTDGDTKNGGFIRSVRDASGGSLELHVGCCGTTLVGYKLDSSRNSRLYGDLTVDGNFVTDLGAGGSAINVSDVGTLRSGGNTNLNLIAGTTGKTGILFSGATRARGFIEYDHSNDTYTTRIAGTIRHTITSALTTINHSLSVSNDLTVDGISGFGTAPVTGIRTTFRGIGGGQVIRCIRGDNINQYVDIWGYGVFSTGNDLLLRSPDANRVRIGSNPTGDALIIDGGNTNVVNNLTVGGSVALTPYLGYQFGGSAYTTYANVFRDISDYSTWYLDRDKLSAGWGWRSHATNTSFGWAMNLSPQGTLSVSSVNTLLHLTSEQWFLAYDRSPTSLTHSISRYGLRLTLARQGVSDLLEDVKSTGILDVRETTNFAGSTGSSSYLPTSAEYKDHGITGIFSVGWPGVSWGSGLAIKGWSGDSYNAWMLMGPSNTTTGSQPLYIRNGREGTWQPWRKLIIEDDSGDVDIDNNLTVGGLRVGGTGAKNILHKAVLEGTTDASGNISVSLPTGYSASSCYVVSVSVQASTPGGMQWHTNSKTMSCRVIESNDTVSVVTDTIFQTSFNTRPYIIVLERF